MNLSDFYSYRIIGKLTDFFTVSGVQFTETDSGLFHFRRSVFDQQLKSRVGLTLGKETVLRIKLNLDGVSITSKSHTHPSHSQTFSFINLVSIFRRSSSPINPVYTRYVDSSPLDFTLSNVQTLSTIRLFSFTEVYSVCRVVFREPMHLCTFVSEEGDDGNTISDVIHT